MTGLHAAQAEFADATERAYGLAAMGQLELGAAIDQSRGVSAMPQLLAIACSLQAYHDSVVEAAFRKVQAWQQLCELSDTARVDRPPAFNMSGPAYGPMPAIEFGNGVVTGMPSVWLRLFGNLNGRDPYQVALCLKELDGWTPCAT